MTRHQHLENTKRRSYSNLKKGTVKKVMKGTVTRMVDKTIKVVSVHARSATVLLRRQVLALLHSEDGRRVTGIPGGTTQPTWWGRSQGGIAAIPLWCCMVPLSSHSIYPPGVSKSMSLLVQRRPMSTRWAGKKLIFRRPEFAARIWRVFGARGDGLLLILLLLLLLLLFKGFPSRVSPDRGVSNELRLEQWEKITRVNKMSTMWIPYLSQYSSKRLFQSVRHSTSVFATRQLCFVQEVSKHIDRRLRKRIRHFFVGKETVRAAPQRMWVNESLSVRSPIWQLPCSQPAPVRRQIASDHCRSDLITSRTYWTS